jgi:pimeloyl-ACP methyl ester carboxylesterase
VIEELRLEANGLRFRALAAGPADAPVALLLHGFPEGAESWLPQLEALAAAGRRAVAPDLRGFGGTDAPEGVESYLMPHLVDDVEGLIDALGVEQVDLAGHDWGALVGWPVTSQRQARVRTWTALSVGHPHALSEAIAGGDADQMQRSAYILLFNQPGKAEEVLLEDGCSRLRAMYQGAFPKDVEDRFVSGLERPGRLTAALSYYRANLIPDRLKSYDSTPDAITAPTLFIWGTDDIALGRTQAEGTAAHVEGPYQFAPLEGAGHWLQHERAAEVSELLVRHVQTHDPLARKAG